MDKTTQNTESTEKKSLLKRGWKGVVGTIAVIGIVWGVLEGVYFFTEEWHTYKQQQEQEERILQRILSLEQNQEKLILYVETKRKSFAVGFRVFKEVDEVTEKVTFKKKYRDWEGMWNDVFYDREASDIYGVDYYFYYHKESGDKIYCW